MVGANYIDLRRRRLRLQVGTILCIESRRCSISKSRSQLGLGLANVFGAAT